MNIPGLECVVLADATQQCKAPPLSPMKTCVSPEAIDEKLAYYVTTYGARWALIRCHMQKEFSVSFPAIDLEKRWAVLQQRMRDSPLSAVPTRSPLTRMVPDNQISPPTPNSGIQERLPLHGLPSSKSKRWRQDDATSPSQPGRPPPQPSPQRPIDLKALPECLQKGLPSFMLAPGSALAAPDSMRRQLKAVYIASRLTALSTEAMAAEAAEAAAKAQARNDGDDEAMDITDASSPRHVFGSEEEKVQIVRLLARELSCLKKGGTTPTTPKTVQAPRSPKTRSPRSPMAPRSPMSPMSPSLLSGFRVSAARSVAASAGCVGSPPRAAADAMLKKRIWPTEVHMR